MLARAARFFLVQRTITGKNIPNHQKMYQMSITYTKCPLNIPNGNEIDQHFPFQGPQKYTYSNWVFWCRNIPSGNTDVGLPSEQFGWESF
jgi:hypothetical protein